MVLTATKPVDTVLNSTTVSTLMGPAQVHVMTVIREHCVKHARVRSWYFNINIKKYIDVVAVVIYQNLSIKNLANN